MTRIEEIIADIRELQHELLVELQQKQEEYLYIIRGKRVQFEEETRRHHRTLKKTLRAYFADAPLLHILTSPIIYACIIPALLLDLFVSVFQAVCFRVYGIPRARRADYIIIDRHNLQYLNLVEKLNCVYCGYFNGLIAYVQEIAARTEQYWCPIKHALRVRSPHARYRGFLDYGDGEGFRAQLEALRDKVRKGHTANAATSDR